MNHHLKEYFTFSKKERTGIIVLLVLILVTALLGNFIPVSSTKPDEATYRRFQQQVALLQAAIDSGANHVPATNDEASAPDGTNEPPHLFRFDPNTLPAEDWKKLGIRERTINTIMHYREKGGRFRKPEDLRKIYGLKPAECERLAAYVHIPAKEKITAEKIAKQVYDSSFKKYDKPAFIKPAIIDINTADTTAFIALRGIGGKLANRIVHFREKLGGFYAVGQVGETYGLPDSTFQQIRAFLQCNSPVIRKINLNTAEIPTLREHPYIHWQLANAIVQYRQQHGAFSSVEQLLQINLITPAILDKIRPYLTIGAEE
jgi:competence ComEA-like helix-hairpin-helix protein